MIGIQRHLSGGVYLLFALMLELFKGAFGVYTRLCAERCEQLHDGSFRPTHQILVPNQSESVISDDDHCRRRGTRRAGQCIHVDGTVLRGR